MKAGRMKYTEENIEDIRKIAYLRTLGISIETIRKIIHHEAELEEVVRELITDYISNSLCFIALSAEIFSFLYLYGFVKNIGPLVIVDTAVLMVILLCGIRKQKSVLVLYD